MNAKIQTQSKATARPFSPIANLCGDAHIMGLSQKLICEANAEHAALVAVAGIVKPLAMALRSSGRDEDGNLSEEDESLIRSALGSLANLAAVRNGGGK